MEERQITVDGTTYPLPAPYFVIATQNPVETQGTFPLPEAQLDRFMLQLKLGYPTLEESVAILQQFVAHESPEKDPIAALSPVCGMVDLLDMQAAVKSVYIHDVVFKYIVDLAEATRSHESVLLGISTRGILALAKMAQAYCALGGEEFVSPKAVLALMPYVYGHRLIIKGGIGRRSSMAMTVLDQVKDSVTAPVETWKNQK